MVTIKQKKFWSYLYFWNGSKKSGGGHETPPERSRVKQQNKKIKKKEERKKLFTVISVLGQLLCILNLAVIKKTKQKKLALCVNFKNDNLKKYIKIFKVDLFLIHLNNWLKKYLTSLKEKALMMAKSLSCAYFWGVVFLPVE